MTFASVLRDHTLDLLTQGYRFADDLRSRSHDPRAGSRVPMRLLGGDALLVRGQDGVKLFYDTDQVRREGAMPTVVGGGLFGAGSLHSMDGAAHLNRKEIFIRAALDRGAVAELLEDARRE